MGLGLGQVGFWVGGDRCWFLDVWGRLDRFNRCNRLDRLNGLTWTQLPTFG